MSKRFFIIDGLSQIFRSYYAPFQQLSSPTGEPVRATYVFCNTLLQLIREQKPDYLAMAMDSPTPSFRRQKHATYKAHRQEPPEDLPPQIARILQIVQAAGIPVLTVPGFEADDILATLATRLPTEHTVEVVMVSRDKDLDQVLSERVTLFDPMDRQRIGPTQLREKKGYGPEQAIEVQTLSGDTSDNVPGVQGVGPKKAAALIAKYGTAAAVLEHADELTPAMRKNVLAFAEQMPLTRELVTLRKDVPLPDFSLEQCQFTGVNKAALYPIFSELGFKRLMDLMAEGTPAKVQPAPPPAAGVQGQLFALDELPTATRIERHYVLVDDEKKFASFLAVLKKQMHFAMDTETTGLDGAKADLVGMSFSWKANHGYYLPIRGVGACLPLESTLNALRPVFENPDIKKIGQNIKYDLVVLAHHGVQVAGVDFDTMIASFVLDSSRRSHGLDALSQELLHITPIPITELIGTGKNQITMAEVSTARSCEYAAEDADLTWQLAECLGKTLVASSVEKLFRETEMPLVEVLTAMEVQGVRLDTAVLNEMSQQLQDRLNALSQQIHELAGYVFNIDSTRQLATVLFDDLKLGVVKKIQTGRSTDAETLDKLIAQNNHPLPALVKEYRELTKLKGTYIDPLPAMICERTGRIHASFHQTGAITGRLSSSNPNLQNIPIRTEIGRQIRRAFVPRNETYVMLTADYSQIELRVLAHFCKDRALREAFENDFDIHQFVAAQVAGVPMEEVTKEQRSRAKAVNFGIVYGQSAFGLSRGTGMSVSEAQTFIDRYFQRYPGIRTFIDRAVHDASINGYAETILGRRRAIPEINSRNRTLKSAAERLAVNTIIQGSAADLIKRAMIAIHTGIQQQNRPSRMLIQVHDELVFDIPHDAVDAEAEFIRHAMCTALPLDVPIKVDINWGDNWLEGK